MYYFFKRDLSEPVYYTSGEAPLERRNFATVLSSAIAAALPNGTLAIDAAVPDIQEVSGGQFHPATGVPGWLHEAGDRVKDDASASFKSVAPQWTYTVWDHADTSPVAISGGVPAILGGMYCTEAFAGTPNPLIQDGTTVLWTTDTATALRASVIEPLEGINCLTDLRVTSSTAGTGGKLLIKWRPTA